MFPLCLFFLLSFCYQILTRSQHTIPHPSLILLLLVFAKCYSLTTKYCYHSDFRIIQSGFNKHAKISCNMPAKNVQCLSVSLCARGTHISSCTFGLKKVLVKVFYVIQREVKIGASSNVCCMAISAALMMTIPSQSKQHFKCITQ